MDSASPFAGILVGQPMLARSLRMGVFAALDQRIATRFALGPMDLGETANYQRHDAAPVIMRRRHPGATPRAGPCSAMSA